MRGRKPLSKELVVLANEDYRRGLTLKQISEKYGVSVGGIYNYLSPIKEASLPGAKVVKVKHLKSNFLLLVNNIYHHFIYQGRSEKSWIRDARRSIMTLPIVRRLLRFFVEVKRFKTLHERFEHAFHTFSSLNISMLLAMEDYIKDPNAVTIAKKWNFKIGEIQGLAKLLQVNDGSNWDDYWRSTVLRLHSRYGNAAAVAHVLGLSGHRVKNIVGEAGLVTGHLRHGFIAEKYKEKIISLHRSGITLTAIAKMYNISEQSLWKRFKEWGVPVIRHQDRLPGIDKLKSLARELSPAEIGVMYGVDTAAVYRRLVAAGVHFHRNRLDYFREGMSSDELKWLYDRLTVEQIGNLLRVAPSTAYGLLLEKEIILRSKREKSGFGLRDIIIEMKERGYSNKEIARAVSRSEGHVSHVLTDVGLVKSPTIVTPELEKKISILYAKGLGRKEIAREFHIPRNTVDYLINKMGIAKRETKYGPDKIKEQTDFIKEKLDEGMPVLKIGEKLGIDKETVRARIRDAGIQTVEHFYTFGKDYWDKLVRRAVYFYLVKHYDNATIAKKLGLSKPGSQSRESAIVDQLLEDADKFFRYHITYFKLRNGNYEPVRTGTVSKMKQILAIKRLLQTGIFAKEIKDLRIWIVKK